MIFNMDCIVRRYLSEIGQRGGKKSRRALSQEQARTMVLVREARRAFKRFQASCFWSYDPNYQISKNDVTWVAQQLKKHGDRRAWEVGERLCR
jgi:hypothetical protein